MQNDISVWKLSRELKSNVRLVAFLCAFYDVPLVDGPRGKLVRGDDVRLVKDLYWCWNSRPKVTSITGPRPRRKIRRAAESRLCP
jgi:hypothetical protein